MGRRNVSPETSPYCAEKVRFIERIEKGWGDDAADFEETREIASMRFVVNDRGKATLTLSNRAILPIRRNVKGVALQRLQRAQALRGVQRVRRDVRRV